MANVSPKDEIKIKTTRFPISAFWITFGILLLVSGLQMGLLVLMEKLHVPAIVEVHMILLYWILAAVLVILGVQWRTKKAYEEPLMQIMEATRKVAAGDFSVYIPPTHTVDKLDYLDATILNINAMVEELGSIETLKTDFISNVSHEMKTPIAIIKNSAQLIEKGNLTAEEQSVCIRDIEAAAGRMSDLITNILKLNKLENQKITPKKEVYDVCRQLCDSILLYDAILEEKGLELEVDMEDRAYVEADEQLMELVWDNLLSNAVKFTPGGGRITVTQTSCEAADGREADAPWAARGGAFVRVTVADTGCGMDAESLKHIFDRFYQGDTSHATEGNGLGLALAKRVIELMDGEIAVQSKVGEGSTFIVTLPMGGRQAREKV